jgi:hypothetical protein
MTARALVLLAFGLSGCAPTAPTPLPPPVSKETMLTGSVTDDLSQPLAGARVTIVDGRQAGFSTVTDAAGTFSLHGHFDDATAVRATRTGYADAGASVQGWWIDTGPVTRSVSFALPPVPPLLVAGDKYTVTLAADDSCTTIPPEFRTRSYDVDIVFHAPYRESLIFGATATGAEFLDSLVGFPIIVTGPVLEFVLNEHGFPYMSERVAPGAYLSFNGGASVLAPPRGSEISVPAAGQVNYCEGVSQILGYWDSSNPECPGPAIKFAACRFSKLTMTPR